jgi:hypothetical protein
MDSAGKYLPQLFSGTGELKLVKTKPSKIVKELLLNGALDKDLYLTDKEGGKKTSLKEALLNLKSSEETNAQPSFTPTITPSEPEKIDPDGESVKSLSEILENWAAKDSKFMDQAVEANKTNSVRISANEVANLRKHFEDEQLKLYVTKVNMTGVKNAKNRWDLAQAAKKVIMDKITEINREEADKPLSECKMEDVATSAYLRLARIMSSSKVDDMARIAKLDEKLGYNSVPLTITFGTLEDKNAFKDSARNLGLNSKDSFPKLYSKQRDMVLLYLINSILFNNRQRLFTGKVSVNKMHLSDTISVNKSTSQIHKNWLSFKKLNLPHEP